MAENTAAFTAPGGTTQALLDALRERLGDCLQHMKLPTDVEGEAARAPDIVDGFLPPKRGKGQARGDFPFVVVRPLGGEDAAHNDASVRVRLVIGICRRCPADAVADDAYRDWMAIKERIRTDLLAAPVVGGRFRFEYPFAWDLPEDQPSPQVLGTVELNFAVHGVIDNTWGEVFP
jgi:hypothetical protein